MIARFITAREVEEINYLDINDVQHDSTLPISIEFLDNHFDFICIHLSKEDVFDLIKVLQKKYKQM